MSEDEAWWEPPLAGNEAEHLLGALDRLRATFRWKADGLDGSGMRHRIGASTLTIGRLLKHLAFVEDYTFRTKFRGESPGEPWASVDWEAHPEWPFTSADGDAPAELYALWDGAVLRTRETLEKAIASGGLDQPTEVSDPEGNHLSLRRLVCDLIEEYGRHTGHADLIRESIDGLAGEDPPLGWDPSGAL